MLTHQALKICFKSTLNYELDDIRSIFVENTYPDFLIDSRISKKLLPFQQDAKEGSKKFQHLILPWMGAISLKFDRKEKLSITNCF